MIKYFDITDSKIYKGFITHKDKCANGKCLQFAIYGSVIKAEGDANNILLWSSEKELNEIDADKAEDYINDFIEATLIKDEEFAH